MRNGNPTICSGSSKVAKAPSPGGGSSRQAPSPEGVAAVWSTISKEPGMRYSNQSRGSRSQRTPPERVRRPMGRNVSRTSGTSRDRSSAVAGSMPPSVR